MTDILMIVILGVLGVWGSVFFGFLMGWKAARPEDKLIKREFNPGPADEPEGDIWQDAMMTEEEKEERISTI